MSSPALPYVQAIDGCLEGRIGEHGLSRGELARMTGRLAPVHRGLIEAHGAGTLALLGIVKDRADIDAAEAALARLGHGARTLVFFGTGGSALGGQTLAQVAGWNIPGNQDAAQRRRPRTRFYDNLDPLTLGAALESLDLAATRFVVTSKSGGTVETLAQVIATLSAVKAAGLEARIPELFLGLTEPARPGRENGLRSLFQSFGIPLLDHHTAIGGRFSVLTNVGLLPALARGLDVRAIRDGAASVVEQMVSAERAEDVPAALGAAVAVGLSELRGVGTHVMMPYADRLGRFGQWFVQLWAESLGKSGKGTTPIACLGPLDQHSQLQLFQDGPRDHLITIVRTPTAGGGPVLDATLAARAGIAFAGGKSIGDLVAAQSAAVPEALAGAGRPVRLIDLPGLDERTVGALLMHCMLETIFAAGLLGIDPYDQPAVELAKTLTRARLAGSG
jgi:glucose-6-phosphate isomerase